MRSDRAAQFAPLRGHPILIGKNSFIDRKKKAIHWDLGRSMGMVILIERNSFIDREEAVDWDLDLG